MDDSGGCIATIIGIVIVIAIIYFIVVYIIIPIAVGIAGVGGIYGGYVSIRNYGVAFKNNVIK